MAVTFGHGSFKGFEGHGGDSGPGKAESETIAEDVPPDILISNNLQKISHNVLQLKKKADTIGTTLDSKELRTEVKILRDATNILTKDMVREQLKQYSKTADDTDEEHIKQELKIKERRFKETFRDVLKDYNDIQKVIRVKLRDSIRTSLLKSGVHDVEIREDGVIIKDGQQVQLEEIQVEIDLDLIKEREEALKELENDISDINDIFKDLAGMIHEQGKVVDAVEENIGITEVNVEQAVGELEVAVKNTIESRKKRCASIVIVVLALIILITLIVLLVIYA